MKNYQIKIISLDKTTLILYTTFLKLIFKKLNIIVSFIKLPKKKKLKTLLTSPHVFKKAREQFFLSQNSSLFLIKNIKNISKLNSFFFINKPKTIKIQIRWK